MQKPNPRGCCGNPEICLKSAEGKKTFKDLPRAAHCTDRAQTSGNVCPTVELCTPHPTFRTKVRARRDVPEGKKNNTILHIHTDMLLPASLFCYVVLTAYFTTVGVPLQCGTIYFGILLWCDGMCLSRLRPTLVHLPHYGGAGP